MTATLQWLSVLSGLAAAALWWLSAQSFFSQSKARDLPTSGGSDGDMAYLLDDGTMVIEHNSRVALTNAWAASLSGLAVLFQAIAQTLPLVGLV